MGASIRILRREFLNSGWLPEANSVSDVVSHETRSKMMSGIRGKDTKPELRVRKALFAGGFRFRLHRRDLPGVPDVVLPGKRIAIFVHGCFWHMHSGCKNAKLPSSRQDFWRDKLARNVERDEVSVAALIRLGWRVLVVWECATREKGAESVLPSALASWIDGDEARGELSGGLKPQ